MVMADIVNEAILRQHRLMVDLAVNKSYGEERLACAER